MVAGLGRFFIIAGIMSDRQLHFVTGRLAEPALRKELDRLASREGFRFTIQVMPISVAALMTGPWIARRIELPPGTTAVILPGYAAAGWEAVQAVCPVPVRLGPRDLRDLPGMFGTPPDRSGFGQHDIAILAEINHAPRLEPDFLLQSALALAADGADIIDLGASPEGGWSAVGDAVRMLKDAGLRTSIDSFDPQEVGDAVRAGAELVLSVNSENAERARDWGVEVVVVPDLPADWQSMESTMERLDQWRVPFRIDPILEPMGVGFSHSLHRYVEARKRWPNVAMMMGIGNLTELTDADSAAINLVLLGFCQEQEIRSVLTTQVINWARSSVRECAIARQMVWYAVRQGIPVKRISNQLLVARDERAFELDREWLEQLAAGIRDRNYRIFSDDRGLAVAGDGRLWQGRDPFAIFDAMLESQSAALDPSHAFYLGYEMCKAELAMQLGKQFTQDQSLDWGYLTHHEPDRHRLKRRLARRDPAQREVKEPEEGPLEP